jgi:tRNA threonylcarbamoyladenosine biosynthesis protein TsaE
MQSSVSWGGRRSSRACPVLVRSSGPADTHDIGIRLGKLLHAGDVVCLFGEIGAGKTTMIKGIASAFGINKRDITSASFTIIAEYDTSPPFYHVDLYRLEGDDDVFGTGVYDYLQGDGVAVIEWAERLDHVPDGAIRVLIEITGETDRTITLEGINEKDRNHL